MKKVLHFAIVLFFAVSFTGNAQDLELTAKDTIVKSSWMVSLGINVVDDSGDEFGNLLDIEDGWNMVPFPSRISVGRYFKNGVGLEAIGTYNRYKEGKVIDNEINTEDIDYFGIDFRVSYDLNQILGETGFFDPYVGIGAGYTDANNEGRGTYNAVVGFRTWFSDHWGLDFNSTGKWAMSTENATNHIQHAVGVVYQFDIEKGLSQKGEEKLALWQELEKEQQRVQDSIAAKQRADEEARLLAERLEKEKEAARLAEAEKNKKESEQSRRTSIENELNALGNVYFALNSSYLTTRDKELLDKLVVILETTPSLELEISSHTDSRGTDKYNQWLSERRAKRTVDYIVDKGIASDRVEPSAFGETRLVNECGDGISCEEEKHQKNRRSEFVISQY
ncbi:OmpA family protein [Flagellimonas allohymeniacidonis]|uniref:OmpA family protein n=1 Tax=Flagellimonas allohymeniacidonis TaxID=2517819 RepID=A0A4Q8QFB5_9FLAO|nr:OmpA family protein [Allomuricauda hymeniacidonis]TAI48554.1 OmpA family protein [Allomuricauda hymeniacidonis]